ncbi:MAG: large ribosomal subunit protein bL28 [Patescibacteria group bacterium]
MKQCYITGKKTIHGRTHTHHRGVAGGRWKKRAQKVNRVFKPNLQRVQIFEDGAVKNVYLCTKVIKRVKKDLTDGKLPKVQIIKFMPTQRQEKIFNQLAK